MASGRLNEFSPARMNGRLNPYLDGSALAKSPTILSHSNEPALISAMAVLAVLPATELVKLRRGQLPVMDVLHAAGDGRRAG
jgi:hypothetical protein